MYNYIFKLCVFGDYNTGKTSFLNLLQNYNYVNTYEPTIGVEFSSKLFKLNDTETVKVAFWDCAGQERFHSVTENFFHNITGGMLFFDVSCRESYNNVLEWIIKFRKKNDDNIPIILVGNKIDKERVISKNDAYILATDFNMKYIEISVKKGINIKNALELLLDNIYENKEENPNIKEVGDEDNYLLLSKPTRYRYCSGCYIS